MTHCSSRRMEGGKLPSTQLAESSACRGRGPQINLRLMTLHTKDRNHILGARDLEHFWIEHHRCTAKPSNMARRWLVPEPKASFGCAAPSGSPRPFPPRAGPLGPPVSPSIGGNESRTQEHKLQSPWTCTLNTHFFHFLRRLGQES